MIWNRSCLGTWSACWRRSAMRSSIRQQRHLSAGLCSSWSSFTPPGGSCLVVPSCTTILRRNNIYLYCDGLRVSCLDFLDNNRIYNRRCYRYTYSVKSAKSIFGINWMLKILTYLLYKIKYKDNQLIKKRSKQLAVKLVSIYRTIISLLYTYMIIKMVLTGLALKNYNVKKQY